MSDSNSDAVRSASQEYAERIAIPEFDENAIRARSGATRAPQSFWRRAAFATVTAAILVALTLNGRAVLAQVEQMMHAVLTVGGTQVPATVRTVSLQEVQRDMPFRVIAPPYIPGYQQSIREVVAQTSPQSSQVMVQYKGSSSPLPITIMESSGNATTTQLRFWMSKNPNAEPPPMQPPMNASPHQQGMVAYHANGGQGFHVNLSPESWTVGSTRIDLMSPPGALTPSQIQMIRSEMSR